MALGDMAEVAEEEEMVEEDLEVAEEEELNI